MNLSGNDSKKLLDSMLLAYPNKNDLEQMVKFKLEENLDSIAGGQTTKEIIFSLISYWAEARGKLKKLLEAVSQDRPDHVKLQETVLELLEKYYGNNSDKRPKPEIESLQRLLDRKCRVLQNLKEEREKSGFPVPVDLQQELEETQNQVKSLEARLAQLRGNRNSIPDTLLPRSPIFIGRKEEIDKCLDALRPEERGWGVAIDGLGGIGKTALALEVAHITRERGYFDAYLFASAKTTWLTPEGVRQETLSLSSLDAFIHEFAKRLGEESILQNNDPNERHEALMNILRGRHTLFVFDNLETLTEQERNLISDFLRKLPAPNKAIITSRYRTGESVLTIRLDHLLKQDAFQIMIEIGKCKPKVADELKHSDEITRCAFYEATGGNPLAINWTLGLIAQKGYSFTESLTLLQQGGYSKDLYVFLFVDAMQDMPKNDQAILVALSTFQTPANINALVDATELNSTQIRMSLERLLNLSLVNDLQGGRYALHPLTRTYVCSALGGGTEEMRTALRQVSLDIADHRKALRYWLDYAQKYGGEHDTVHKTFDFLEKEWPSLESTAISLRELSGIPGELKDAEMARMLIEIADALRTFLWFKGYWDERLLLSEWAYHAAKSLGFWRDAGWAAYSVAWIYCNRSETDRANIWADRTTEAMTRGGNRHDRSVARHLGGIVARECGNLTEAKRLLTEAISEYQTLKEEADEAIALNDLGIVADKLENYDDAEDFYRQSIEINQKRGEESCQAAAWGNWGDLAMNRERWAEARSRYQKQLELARKVNRQDIIANALFGLARILEQENCYGEALSLAEESLKISVRLRHSTLKKTYNLLSRLRRKLGEE